jgi:hypothetical protein
VHDTVKLADDIYIPIHASCHLKFTIQDRIFCETFDIMPALGNEMLIGVDVWAALGFSLPPPPRHLFKLGNKTATISGGMTPRTSDEEQRLQNFLGTELKKFAPITGLIDRIQHRLRLTDA